MKAKDCFTMPIEKVKLTMSEEKSKRKQLKKDKLERSGNRFIYALMFFLEPILPGDGSNTDGRIASLVYLICLTTAGIVMNVTSWLQSDGDVNGVTTDHIDGFLMTCICPALLWILYIFCKQNDRKTLDFISPLPHSHRPLMAGAYVFGAGSCVMDVLHVTFYLECSAHVSSLAFTVFKVLFIVLQILFLRKFANATLHKSQNIRLVLFHILGTNVCIWFRALFNHAKLIFSSGKVQKFEGFNTTMWCPQNNSPMVKIWEASEPYLYPFTMEYSLIAGGILYTMWSGMRDLDPDPQDIYIYDELGEFHCEDSSECKEDFKDDSSGYLGSANSFNWSPSESHLSLTRTVSTTSLCKSCHENQENMMNRYNPSSDPGLLLGLLLSIFLFLSIALLWLDSKSIYALRMYYLYQITLHAVMCCALWLILKALLNQTPSWYPYNPDDTLLMTSFTGVFLYTGLNLAAAVSETNNMSHLGGLLGTKSVLVLLESMLQVTAILKALRFKPINGGSGKANLVRQGTLFLIATNFALWGQDSFYDLRTSVTTPIQNKLFGDLTWRAITVFAYPLCIFFRFHSTACLFEIWSTFRNSW